MIPGKYYIHVSAFVTYFYFIDLSVSLFLVLSFYILLTIEFIFTTSHLQMNHTKSITLPHCIRRQILYWIFRTIDGKFALQTTELCLYVVEKMIILFSR